MPDAVEDSGILDVICNQTLSVQEEAPGISHNIIVGTGHHDLSCKLLMWRA